jgi:hypothetical protein
VISEIAVSEERRFALLFAATILAARRLADLGELADKPCPAREAVIATAISKAELILRRIDDRYPPSLRSPKEY